VALTVENIHGLFKSPVSGEENKPFAHVSDDVDWTVQETHPLAGHCRSKDSLLVNTFEELNKVLSQCAQLKVEHILVNGDWTVFELHSLATVKDGLGLDNRYCCVCRFAGNEIVQARAHLDSALVAELFTQNPIRKAVLSSFLKRPIGSSIHHFKLCTE
jgi:uncharacterized protein